MNPAHLQQKVTSLEEENAQLKDRLKASEQENFLLRQKIDALARRYFGKKSEQLNSAQMELLLSGLDEIEAEVKPAPKVPKQAARRTSNGTQRVRTPENLDVVQRVIEPREVQAQPQQWEQISQETSRQLDYQPGKFFWLETVRPKYVRVGDRQTPPVVAPAPERASGMAAPGLLAHLLVGKFCDHLPFYRQQMIYRERHGVFIQRQQMVQWMRQGTALLEGVVREIKKDLQSSGYVQVDETPVDYLDPGKGRCSQGYLWTGHVPGRCVVFEWHASRGAQCLESLLGTGYRGKIQSDGYSAYPAFARVREGIELFGCWAHARRDLFEAKEEAPRQAGWLLRQVGMLFEWEAQLRDGRAGPRARQAMRSSHHRMVMKRLLRALVLLKGRYLPKSGMGRAIQYILNQWTALERIADHGEVEWSNNLVENQIRPTAVGKKNFLFFGAEEAGQRNAVVYTLIANCRLHGIEPYGYLKDLLTRLPMASNQDVGSFVPRRWKAAQASAAAKTA